MPRKILFINQAHPVLEKKLTDLGYECHLHFDTPKEEIERMLLDFFGVVMRSRINVDQSFIDAGTNLKFIAREGVGIEHIDVEYAKSKGIEVITSPEGSQDTVAEHAMAHLLNLLNHINRANNQVKAGVWSREENRAIELKGKTVGIIGYGNMGRSFAKRLSGFDCKVIAYDKYKTDYGDEYAEAVSLSQLQAESDIISLHVFYERENHLFVNDEYLSAFQKNIFVINTARGLVLDTAALVRHLKTGKVRGAALDVLEYEEQSFSQLTAENLPPAFTYLTEADNVILAPHIAGWSSESKEGHGRVLGGKIEQQFGRGNVL
ncbi:MAG: NAD(P)-dependent oxidoreductase [Bacteroidota bacterium]